MDLPSHPHGPLRTADYLAETVFSGSVTADWIRRFLMAGRVKLSARQVRWYEDDVKAYLAGLRTP